MVGVFLRRSVSAAPGYDGHFLRHGGRCHQCSCDGKSCQLGLHWIHSLLISLVFSFWVRIFRPVFVRQPVLGVQRTAIFRQPTNFDLLTWGEAFHIRGVPSLNHKLFIARNRQTCAEDITHVNELFHFGFQRVCAFLNTVFIVFNTFRTDRNPCPRSRLYAFMYWLTVDQLAVVQFHNRDAVVDLFDHTFQRVVLADELRHKAVLWVFIQCVRWIQLLNAAIVKNRHAVGHGQGFGLVVGHINRGDTQIVRQIGDLKLHFFTQLLVQRAKRFIHQNQLGFKHQCTRQGDPLLLSTRKLSWPAATKGAHLNHIQGAFDFFFARALAHFTHLQWEAQVFRNRHMREQRVVLEHHANATLVRRNVVDGGATKANVAVCRRFKACQHHEASCLARA
mmetsp:Transcript_22335/g.35678  ORF Transcript_22335/g.35678 Transcript_22335/m.35678 type:complete len:392 (-) Transcript_22335:779-1954(-)